MSPDSCYVTWDSLLCRLLRSNKLLLQKYLFFLKIYSMEILEIGGTSVFTMGNVQASSFGFSQPPPMTEPISTETEDIVKPPPVVKDPFPDNPGTVEDLHKKCKDVFPMNFEGGKFMLNKPLTNHFQVSHSLDFPVSQPPGYKFGATYVGTHQTAPSEAYPVLLGEFNASGNLNANIIHQFTPAFRSKFVAQIADGSWQAAQGTADYRWSTGTATLTAGNIDLYSRSGVLVTQCLQRVAPNLDLGLEVAYQYGPHIPGGSVTVPSLMGRYANDKFTASGSVGRAGLHACYYQKASENLQIGVELETSFRMPDSTASIGYQVDIPKANFTFKGTADTNWTVGCVLEKKLAPLPFTFTLSLLHNHTKQNSKIGAGFIIG